MKLIKIIIFLTLCSSHLFAKNDFFNEGLNLFEKSQFEKAKFKFEQDIVYNPKNEKSYLYLSKIFKKLEKKELEEKNLNTVILLNPKNEDAVYSLAKLRLKKSDFEGSKKLIDQLLVFCKKYCQKSNDLQKVIENSLKK